MTANDREPGRAESAGSLWWTVGGVLLVTVIAVWPGEPSLAALVLAGVMGISAVVRLVAPEPGPTALVVRGRALDGLLLGGFAITVAVLALLLPG